MKEVIVYSTGCPKCELLKKLLQDSKIVFSEVTDIVEMLSLGFDEVPMLKYDGKIFDYTEAVKAIKNGEIK